MRSNFDAFLFRQKKKKVEIKSKTEIRMQITIYQFLVILTYIRKKPR